MLDAIYAGSVTGIANALHPDFRRFLTDESARGASALLKAQFGDVRQLALDRVETAGPGITQGVWRVDGTRGTFQMRIWIRQEEVAGIEFRPSTEVDWAPMPMMGIEYGRHGRKPAGW